MPDAITPDFAVQNEGSLVILKPNTDAARQWVAEHIPDDAPRWCGGIAIEPRFFDAIAEGAQADGLTLD